MNIEKQPTVIEMLEKDLGFEEEVLVRLEKKDDELATAIQQAYINGMKYALEVIKLNQ